MWPVSTRGPCDFTTRVLLPFTSPSLRSPHAPGPVLGRSEIAREVAGSAATSSARAAPESLAPGPAVLCLLYLFIAFDLFGPRPLGDDDAPSDAAARRTPGPRLGGACADANSSRAQSTAESLGSKESCSR